MQYSIIQHKGRWEVRREGEILYSGTGGIEVAISVLLSHGIALSEMII